MSFTLNKNKNKRKRLIPITTNNYMIHTTHKGTRASLVFSEIEEIFFGITVIVRLELQVIECKKIG